MRTLGHDWDLTGPLGSQPLDNYNPEVTNKCGVNPVTGSPGIDTQPYNQQGNLRSDRLGSGEFKAPRGNRKHTGIDIFGQLNQPVVSFLSGTVTRVAPNNGGYGNTIEVTSEGGIVSKYHHLATINVAEGDTVGTGQGIGTLGQTGNAGGTNPHVDFEIFKIVIPYSIILVDAYKTKLFIFFYKVHSCLDTFIILFSHSYFNAKRYSIRKVLSLFIVIG